MTAGTATVVAGVAAGVSCLLVEPMLMVPELATCAVCACSYDCGGERTDRHQSASTDHGYQCLHCNSTFLTESTQSKRTG